MTGKPIQEVVSCMGQPVAGNPTEFMFERAFKAAGLDWRYVTFEVAPEDLEAALAGMRGMGFRGGNFTIPHKVKVIEYLDGLSEAAELMGAVNCVNATGGQLIGENTDGKGFVASLKELVEPEGTRVVMLGAGGAARAIAVELGLGGVAEIVVVNRTESRGQELVDLINDRVGVAARLESSAEQDFAVPQGTDIVINCTSIGLGDAEARVPLEIESLEPSMVVADVVFNPPETKLLRDAAAAGCRVLDGLGMLVNQAVIGFRIWTGVEPDANVMREALEEYLDL